MDNSYLLGIFAVMGIATFITRALPFVVFSKVASNPVLDRFGNSLPPMIMVVLVCFGLASLEIESVDRGGLSALALALVIALHCYFKNPLLSILVGTGVYVIGIQGFGF
jgi:branched-subunit amino acid transport protein AzlD